MYCVYLFMYLFLYFLKFILSIVWRTTLETTVLLCALMCLSSVNIIFICIIMFYQINSLTHMILEGHLKCICQRIVQDGQIKKQHAGAFTQPRDITATQR